MKYLEHPLCEYVISFSIRACVDVLFINIKKKTKRVLLKICLLKKGMKFYPLYF